ncbi:hypothetical protein J437_LFUL015249 [Ladona fulva]|uniref:C2H2-type domain-containing protein n=1 Tax=Ladona fulva TaxID=123851 RepID=A0A8K0KJV3_LADFU|nr:hypothetical protein J437_LFUL015249 [Ladona fulva]
MKQQKEGLGQRNSEVEKEKVKDANRGISKKDRENVGIEGKKSVDCVNSKRPSGSEIPIQGSKKVHYCYICKDRFELKHDLSRHMWVHYDKMPYSCKVCGERFRKYTLKKAHEITHLREERNKISRKGRGAKMHPCGTCRKEFSSQSALRQHSEGHSKKYLCNFCGKCFQNNDDLKGHLRSHSNKRKLWCDICQKSFDNKDSLNSHMDSHLTRPFKCSLCTKIFKTRKSRDQHELTHPRKK